MTQVEPTATCNGPISLDAPSGSPAMAPKQLSTPHVFGEMRAGDLVGESIYNMGGESLGEIDNVVVNRDDNAVTALAGIIAVKNSHENRLPTKARVPDE